MTVSPIEFHLPSVTSTNDYAKELLSTYPFVFVSAQHQTSGRGRKGRTWQGMFGQNVYCSLGVRHAGAMSLQDVSSYMWRGALAVIRTLRSIDAEHKFRMKYPNDIEALDQETWKKIAGILVEHEFQADRCLASIIGIGINVLQLNFDDLPTATSLSALGTVADVDRVINELRINLTGLHEIPSSEVFTQWVNELSIVDKTMIIQNEDGIWKVVQIFDDGRLLVRNVLTKFERIISDGDSVRYND